MSRMHDADTFRFGDERIILPSAGLAREMVFAELAFATVLDHDGYEEIAQDQLRKLAAWLRYPVEERPPVADSYSTVEAHPNRWVLIRVTVRQEGFVLEALKEAGITAYVPQHVTEARHARRKATRERPLIPGYVFACLPSEHTVAQALAIHGVQEIMCRDGEIRRLPLLEVGALILAEACHCFDETWQPPPVKGRRYSHRWKPGDAVRIDNGPFHGFVATVIRASNRKRMRVQVTLFGKVLEVEVQHRQLLKLN